MRHWFNQINLSDSIFEPSDYEPEHENFLRCTVKDLHIDFSETLNIVVWPWNNLNRGIGVPKNCFFNEKQLIRQWFGDLNVDFAKISTTAIECKIAYSGVLMYKKVSFDYEKSLRLIIQCLHIEFVIKVILSLKFCNWGFSRIKTVSCHCNNSFKPVIVGLYVDFVKNENFILWSRDSMFWGLLLSGTY